MKNSSSEVTHSTNFANMSGELERSTGKKVPLNTFGFQSASAEAHGQPTPEELSTFKSTILNEDEAGRITCPSGTVLRILTAQYRLTDNTVCPVESVSTCRNKCPGSFLTTTLAKRCDFKTNCPVKARPPSARDTCQSSPEPLCILYTCAGNFS